MISMQQLEELESRIIKALQLIGDLRTENSKLESDNESLKVQAEEARLSLEEKEQELVLLQRELDATTKELADLKSKEEVLEKKVIALLGKMDYLQSGGGVPAGDSASSAAKPHTSEPAVSSFAKTEPVAASSAFAASAVDDEPAGSGIEEAGADELKVETVAPTSDVLRKEDEDDIIIIDANLGNEEPPAVKAAPVTAPAGDDDEIILIDESDDEIVIDDIDDDSVILDESAKSADTIDDDIIMDDDDFIIVEEDKK